MSFTEKIVTQTKVEILTLTESCVVELHNILSKNYAELPELEPVSPPGVKDYSLLASAVSRQHTSLGTHYKYHNAFLNCATLVFGVIKNHSFFNGNKRVGLLCLIKHLYVNGYVLSPSLKMNLLYELVVAIADNSVPQFINKNNRNYRGASGLKLSKPDATLTIDEQIDFLAWWLRQNTESKTFTIGSTVKAVELKRILESKGYKFEQKGTFIVVWEERKSGLRHLLTGQKTIVNKREYAIGSFRTDITNGIVSKIRSDYNLTNSDGFDNRSFYDEESFIDEAVVKYKKVIYRLSRT